MSRDVVRLGLFRKTSQPNVTVSNGNSVTNQPSSKYIPDYTVKGEVNLNIKLHLNDSFYTLINKYHPYITKFCVVLKKFPNFEVILHTYNYRLVLLSLKIGTIYRIYPGGV